jgi:broad specificity phosphatase PhoE
MDDFQKRVNDFSNELKASAHNQVLVVSHGVVLRYLYCKLSGYDVDTLNKIPFKNNEIKTVRVI